jgi:hypothetical protein
MKLQERIQELWSSESLVKADLTSAWNIMIGFNGRQDVANNSQVLQLS